MNLPYDFTKSNIFTMAIKDIHGTKIDIVFGGIRLKRVYLFVMATLMIFSSSCSLIEIIGTDRGELNSSAAEHNGLDEENHSLEERGDIGFYILNEFPDSDLEICPPQETAFITDLNVHQAPAVLEPEPRTSYRDPVFDTCVVRVTDRQHDILNSYDTSKGVKHEYSRVQSFNADNSLLLVWATESYWYVYDTASLLPLGEVPVYAEPRWDYQNPYLLYYTEETKLISYDLSTGKFHEIRDFAKDFPEEDVAAVWMRYEGSPSYDSRYWGLLAQDSEWEPFAFLIYDLHEDSVVLREIPLGYSIDHVTISPLGTYLLASFDDYCEHGQLGSDQNPCGLMVYDSNLENGRSLLRIIGHYDALLDADNREVIIFQDIDTDNISMLDLESGKVTALFPIDFSYTGIGFHFSGRASDLPGWGLVSTYNGGHPTDFTWMDDSIFAVELKEHGRVVRLAHTHSLYDEDIEQDYWAEPHASVNQNFTRILFTSNWGRTGTEEVDMYMIVLPENWVDLLP
jgi:hypothetical protein